jgi:hypothetical protein
VEQKCEKLKEDQDLGHTVDTGVEQKCEKWKEDQDLGRTVDTGVEQKCEKWNENTRELKQTKPNPLVLS